MRPTLFEAFGYPLPSYAVLMVLGFIAALAVIFVLTPKKEVEGDGGFNRSQVWDLFIVMVISSILGSKFAHVLFEASAHEGVTGVVDLLQQDPWHWARLGEPGYVWYGGMIGALSAALFYFWRRPHLDAWQISDAFAPAIMVGASVGRFGCYLAGCCHGQPTDAFFGVQFPRLAGPVHPTQLYDCFIAGALGAWLLWKFHRRKFKGENIAWLLILYPALRATTEVFRGDAERGYFGPLSTSQLLSIPLLLIGIYLYARLSKQAPPASPPAPAADPPSEPAEAG